MLHPSVPLLICGLGILLLARSLWIEVRARRRHAALLRIEQTVRAEAPRGTAREAGLPDGAGALYAALDRQPAASREDEDDDDDDMATEDDASGPPPSRAIHQAARELLVQHPPSGLHVQTDADGGCHLMNGRGEEVEVHSRASVDSLRRDLLQHPRDCVVNHETYEELRQDGTWDQLHAAGATLYDGPPHDAVLEQAHVISDLDAVTDHGVSALVLARSAVSVARSYERYLQGRASASEAGKDAVVDVGFAIGGTSVCAAAGAAIGTVLLPGPGTVAGKLIGAALARPIAAFLKETWKYGSINKHLRQVGQQVHQALSEDAHSRRRVCRRLADQVFSRPTLARELEAAEADAGRYAAELMLYASPAVYRPPTAEGARCRLRARAIAQELARADRAAERVITRLLRSCQGADGQAPEYGRLGEIACAQPECFSPVLSEADVQRYTALHADSPNHPFRIRLDGDDPVHTGTFFRVLCHTIHQRTRAPALPRPPVPGRAAHRFSTAIAAVLLLTGPLLYARQDIAMLADHVLSPQPPAPVQRAAPPPAESASAEAERQRFAALSSQQHLMVARTALARGYDRRSRTGGDLELAERHLRAVPIDAKEAPRARSLLAEIRDRRRREDRSAGAAGPRAVQAVARERRLPSPPEGSQELLADPGPPVQPTGPKEGLAQAVQLLAQRRYGEAELLLRALQATGEDEVQVQVALGECAAATGRYPEALAHYNEALALRADHPPAHLGIADAYRAQGDMAHAAEWYRSYLSHSPAGAGAGRARRFLARIREQEAAGE